MASDPSWLTKCGIEAYANPSLIRFKGVIKTHAEDFQVTEIDLNGKHASVSDKTIPENKEFKMKQVAPSRDFYMECFQSKTPSKELVKLIGEENVDEIMKLRDAKGYPSNSAKLFDLVIRKLWGINIEDALKQNRLGNRIHSILRMDLAAVNNELNETRLDEADRLNVLAQKFLLTDEASDIFHNARNSSFCFTHAAFCDKEARTKVIAFTKAIDGNLNLNVFHVGGQTYLFCTPNKNRSQLCELMDVEAADRILKFASGKPNEEDFVKIEVENDRARRTKVHRMISKMWKQIDTKTVDDGSAIKLYWKKRRGKKRKFSEKTFLKFGLKKVKREQNSVVRELSDLLQTREIHRAGAKDKFGVTFQWMTAANVSPMEVANAGEKMNRVEIGNIHWTDHAIQLGELQGNAFKLKIRECTVRSEDLQLSETSLREKGFINYFGVQRFGSGKRTPTTDFAKALLQKDFERFLRTMLPPEAITPFENNEYDEVYSMVDSRAPVAGMIRALKRFGKDEEGYRRAILTISATLRDLYVAAYQSELWNKAVTERLKENDNCLQPGDLVIKPEFRAGRTVQREHVVTYSGQDNLDFRDLVIPLIGYNPISSSADEFYEKMLKKDGLRASSMKNMAIRLSMGASLRRVFIRPLGLQMQPGSDDTAIFQFSLGPSQYATSLLREVMDIQALNLAKTSETL